MKSRTNRLKTKRFLGLDLSGAKNQKTTLAAIEYFPFEKKIFVLEIMENLGPEEGASGDEVLLEMIQDCQPGISSLCVNAPLTVPPCISCTRKSCPLPKNCTVPSVKWMRQLSNRSKKKSKSSQKEFTPYTQRPIELWTKLKLISDLPSKLSFDVDEALGGTKAPLTARLSFLKRHLGKMDLIETFPKLCLAALCTQLKIPQRAYSYCRHLEKGPHARREILEYMIEELDIFIYARDLEKLSINLSAFDAFLCAYTALLWDSEECAKPPKGFPKSSGWVAYPKIY